MQDLYVPYFNEKTNEYNQIIITPTASFSRHLVFRVSYGCIFASYSSRYRPDKALSLVMKSNIFNQLRKERQTDIHSPILFKDGKGYIHALGERIDLDYSLNLEKQINDCKKHVTALLKKAVKPMIDSALKNLSIEGAKYKISITSSISYVGQNTSVRTYPRKTSFTPEEIVRKEYTLRFSWYLGMFSPKIIESIVIHEVAHCLEQHHNKKFYSLVYNLCPNYDYYRKCIENGYVKGVNNEL